MNFSNRHMMLMCFLISYQIHGMPMHNALLRTSASGAKSLDGVGDITQDISSVLGKDGLDYSSNMRAARPNGQHSTSSVTASRTGRHAQQDPAGTGYLTDSGNQNTKSLGDLQSKGESMFLKWRSVPKEPVPDARVPRRADVLGRPVPKTRVADPSHTVTNTPRVLKGSAGSTRRSSAQFFQDTGRTTGKRSYRARVYKWIKTWFSKSYKKKKEKKAHKTKPVTGKDHPKSSNLAKKDKQDMDDEAIKRFADNDAFKSIFNF